MMRRYGIMMMMLWHHRSTAAITSSGPFRCFDRCGRACQCIAVRCVRHARGLQHCGATVAGISQSVVVSVIVIVKGGDVWHGSDLLGCCGGSAGGGDVHHTAVAVVKLSMSSSMVVTCIIDR